MIAAVLAGGLPALASGSGSSPPAVVARALTAARLAGEGRLTWWGFAAYEARLWVAPGFIQRAFDRHPLALELTYLRKFKSEDIVRTSLEEMRRGGSIDDEQAQRWEAQLRAVIPDVSPGDRLAGIHRPDRGASFYFNGQPAGEIADAKFSRLFFAIWLGAATSQPGLRAALLGDTPP